MHFNKILVLLLFLILSISKNAVSQYYSGPASATISGGAAVSTGTLESNNNFTPKYRIGNQYWEKYNMDYIDDIFDNSIPAAPAGSNEIVDKINNRKTKSLSDSIPAVVIDFKGIAQTSSIPPDPVVAVGPNHVIACVNTAFTIFDKAGNELYRSGAELWFNNVVSGNEAFDPQIIYDHYEDRWVQLWDSQPTGTSDAWYLISVSDDSDPMGTWYNYAFPANKNGPYSTNYWADYPQLGYDHNVIYVSGRMFGLTGGFFYSQLRWVSKSELYNANGGSVTYTDIWDLRDPQNLSMRVDGPPVAAVHLDSSNTGYIIVDSPYYTSNFVTLWEIQDPLGTPVISATNIPTTAANSPLDGQQLGGGQALNVGRRTYRDAVYQDGSIWGAMNIRPASGINATYARYIRLDANSKTLIEDYAFGQQYYYYLYPEIMVDEYNNMIMVYTRTGITEYAGFGYTGRKDIDPLGYLSPTRFVKEGGSNYIKMHGSRNRWGDYMGVAQDPVNRSVMWSLVEYAEDTPNTWGTWIAAFTHSYSGYGIIKDASNQNPIEFANMEIIESGKTILTDSTGEFSFGSPTETININVNAFAYQDTSVSVSLTLYTPMQFDIELFPEIESTVSGQIVDSNNVGIYAELKFYAEGNPYPGPYGTVTTDTSGNFSFTTIIGNYDIEIYPESPFAYKKVENLVLNAGGLQQDITVYVADVMLIDDDNGEDYEVFYFEDFKSIGVTYHHWDIQIDGAPTAADRNAYPSKTMFWFTGDSSNSPLTPNEQNEILDHISTGGKLLLTGQDIAEMNSGSSLTNNLGIDFSQNSTLSLIIGVGGDVIGNALVFNVSGYGGANNQTSSDAIQIIDSSSTTTIFHYGGGTSKPAGARYENVGTNSKAVFLGFGAESINDPSRRQTLLTRVLEYLGTIATGINDKLTNLNLPDKFELKQNFPNPFNPETTIKYNIPGKSHVVIVVYNTLGQKIKTLLNKEVSAGSYSKIWNGQDDFGNVVSSGVYFYQLFSDTGFNQTRKLLFIK